MAPSDRGEIEAELNKLKKQELIEILLTKRLPANITSVVLKKFVQNMCLCKINSEKSEEIFYDADADAGMCVKTMCLIAKKEEENLRAEVGSLNKLIFHLEKRANEQEQLIEFLKNNNKRENHENSKTIQQQPSSSKTVNSQRNLTITNQHRSTSRTLNQKGDHSHDNTQKPTENNVNKHQINYRDPSPNKQFVSSNDVRNAIHKAHNNVLRKYHSPRGKPIIGNNASSGVKTIPKKGFLHVYRMAPKTAEDDMIAYLKTTAPNIQFTCKKLKENEFSSSFMMEFPIERHQEVYNPNIWPQGAAVRRYIFPRKREPENFQENASTMKK